jgi:hypothetical protein
LTKKRIPNKQCKCCDYILPITEFETTDRFCKQCRIDLHNKTFSITHPLESDPKGVLMGENDFDGFFKEKK